MMFGFILVMFGILFILSGFMLIFISSIYGAQYGEKRDEHSLNSNPDSYHSYSNDVDSGRINDKNTVNGGGILMLGPIPIIIGSDSKSVETLIILSIVLMLLYFFIFM